MVRSRTEVFYGTIDCFAIAMNLLSFIALKKFSRMFSSELIILIGSITILSLSGCTLFVTKMLKNFDGPGNLASLASLAVPISYNLFLPAILSKGFKQLHPEDKHHVSCSYLYAIVCCSLVVFFVMVISPMPGMDYHKFQQPVHAPHPGLHTSVATPLLMICGAVPQLFAAFLSLIQVLVSNCNSIDDAFLVFNYSQVNFIKPLSWYLISCVGLCDKVNSLLAP